MTNDVCPTQTELTAAISTGPSGDVRRHVASCTRCSDEWNAIDRVVNTYRKLPWQDSSPSQIEEQRTALLASAALAKPQGTRQWLRWALPAVAAAAITLVVMTRPAPSAEPAFHGLLTPQGATAFSRISSRPDEVVLLTTGSLSVEVSPLRNGERFRVVTSDAEVEVRGTAFEVTADGGRLVAVHVWHGKVEVRPSAGGAVVLGGGESWARPALTASATSVTPTGPVARPPSPAADVRADPPSTKPERERSLPANTSVVGQRKLSNKPGAEPVLRDHMADAGALAYQEAWSALRAGDHASAAKEFERAATVAPRSALAEDAWYWRAVSLARSKQSSEARAAFASFLEKYQSSPRVPQASAMLGWLLFEAADLDGAEVRFRAAASDPDPAVRNSAKKGRDAVRQRRSETK